MSNATPPWATPEGKQISIRLRASSIPAYSIFEAERNSRYSAGQLRRKKKVKQAQLKVRVPLETQILIAKCITQGLTTWKHVTSSLGYPKQRVAEYLKKLQSPTGERAFANTGRQFSFDAVSCDILKAAVVDKWADVVPGQLATGLTEAEWAAILKREHQESYERRTGLVSLLLDRFCHFPVFVCVGVCVSHFGESVCTGLTGELLRPLSNANSLKWVSRVGGKRKVLESGMAPRVCFCCPRCGCVRLPFSLGTNGRIEGLTDAERACMSQLVMLTEGLKDPNNPDQNITADGTYNVDRTAIILQPGSKSYRIVPQDEGKACRKVGGKSELGFMTKHDIVLSAAGHVSSLLSILRDKRLPAKAIIKLQVHFSLCARPMRSRLLTCPFACVCV